jgi:hypothetical protein
MHTKITSSCGSSALDADVAGQEAPLADDRRSETYSATLMQKYKNEIKLSMLSYCTELHGQLCMKLSMLSGN